MTPFFSVRPTLALAALVPLFLTGCSGGDARSESPSSSAEKQTYASSPAAADATGGAAGGGKAEAKSVQARRDESRKIIYTGQVNLNCENLDAAAAGLERRVREFGAYVGDANRSGARAQNREATWTIRVPSDRFDAFLSGLPSLGEFVSSTRQAQDVTEEYYDAEARMKNKRVEEARLVDLLKRVAGNLDQILRVETELSRIREEIEGIEGRMRYLSHLTALSTVTITIREVKTFLPPGPPTFAARVGRTWSGSIETLAEFGTALVLLFVGLAPWIGPLALVGIGALLVRRRLRRVARPPIARGEEGSGAPPMRPI